MNQTEKVAYYPNLLGQPEIVVSQNIDSKKGLEEYLAIMNERANIEEQYQKGLVKLSSWIDKSNIIFMKEQLVQQLKNKISRIQTFVDLIRSEIQEKVKETLNQQNNISNKIIDEIKQLEQSLLEKKEKILLAKLNYKLKSKEVEESGILDMIYQYSLDIPEDQKIKQICRTQSITFECSKLLKQYQILTISYNDYLDVYRAKMESYLIQMEEFEQKKLLVLKDTLLKLFLVEVTMSKDQFQEVEKINEQIRNTNIQDVIENFIMKYNRPDFAPNQINFQHYCTFLSKKIESLRSQEYQKLKDLIKAHSDIFYTIYSEVVEKNNQQVLEQQEIEQLINQDTLYAYYKLFIIHINNVWNGNKFTNNQQIIQLLQQSTLNKLIWLIALDIEADKNNYRVSNSTAFEQIIQWSQILIKLCSESFDTAPLRKLITLSSLIHFSNSNKKYYLMNTMQDNYIFTTPDFIQANILEAVYDGLVEEINAEKNQIEKIQRQKINFFTQISKICFTLLIYNKNDTIKKQAENYLKLLKIPSNSTEDLIFQIESYRKL